VFVQRQQRLLDAVMGQQLSGVAVSSAQIAATAFSVSSARGGQVAEVADRRGHDVERPAGYCWGLHDLSTRIRVGFGHG
jgi:hypothetical protein